MTKLIFPSFKLFENTMSILNFNGFFKQLHRCYCVDCDTFKTDNIIRFKNYLRQRNFYETNRNKNGDSLFQSLVTDEEFIISVRDSNCRIYYYYK